MESENKLDEDFLFYLSFVNSLLQRIRDPKVRSMCQAWLYKLCAESIEGTQLKRCRNIFLTRLLICMQTNTLEGPFLLSPADVDLMTAHELFDFQPTEPTESPAWLEDSNYIKDEEGDAGKKGRTYLATRVLPNGQGAFAYIGISMGGDEPRWVGGAGEGEAFDALMQEKFAEHVPPVHEMEKILARRKDPKERERVLTFYDVLMQNIADELDEKTVGANDIVEGLLEQLIQDLIEKDRYAEYEQMDEGTRRYELLLLLHERVYTRRNKIQKREEILDEIEEKVMPHSFFETSDVQPEDKYEFPAAMWAQVINRLPTKKQMENLQKYYPLVVLEMFLKLQSDYKEQISIRMQRRHENMVLQMKKELRKEGERMRKRAEESQEACTRAMDILKEVRTFHKRKEEMEERNQEKFKVPVSEHTKVYEAMKEAVLDTQKLVEQEAERGRFLAAQINAISGQTEVIMQVNEEMVEKTEAANMKILRSIKQLKAAINMYENRIRDLQSVATSGRGKASEVFFM